MKIGVKHICFILLGVIAVSCIDIKIYPPEPIIEFKSMNFVDTLDALENRALIGKLTIFFIDGDGDIGTHAPVDTTEEEEHTVFIDFYKVVDNTPIYQVLDPPMRYRVPYFSTSGNNKTLQGEIVIRDINIYSPNASDTMMYKFYIKDRAGNISNTDSTGFLPLRDYLKVI